MTWDSVKVKELRSRLGLTREDFAALVKVGGISVSPNTVYRWEANYHKPSPYHQGALDRVAKQHPED